MSAITRLGFDPRTNYVKYALAAGGAFAIFGLTLGRGTSLLTTIGRGLRQAGGVAGIRGRTGLAIAGLTAAFVIVAINLTAAPSGAPLVDTFHEGERLGFLPAARGAPRPFERIFLVHGFGLNVLPALVADRLADGPDRIALVRLGVVALHLLGYLGALATVILAVCVADPSAARRRALAAALGALVLAALVFRIDVRDTMFLLQVPWFMGFLAAVRRGQARRAVVSAVVLGASLPVAFLYVYDRAVYMAMIAGLVTMAMPALGRRALGPWLGGMAVGLAAGVAGLIALVGTAGVQDIAEQVVYWGRYGSYIWAQAWLAPCCGIRDIVLLVGALLVQFVTIGRLWRQSRAARSLRTAVANDMPLVVLLVASLVFTRIALGRADPPHFYFATMPSMLLVAVLAGAVVGGRDREAPTTATVTLPRGYLALLITLSVALGVVAGRGRILLPSALVKPLNPVTAVSTIMRYGTDFARPDALMLAEGDWAAVQALRPEVTAGRCFFTLTSEGGWYQLFDRPSCSRFHHLVYARTAAAQAELIAALEREQPPVILFANGRNSSAIDGATIFNTNAPVLRYVMTAYRPYKTVGGHWFWRRAQEPYRPLDVPAGRIEGVPPEVLRSRDVTVTGTVDQGLATPESGAILVTVGPADVPIWAGQAVSREGEAMRFRAQIPTAALAPGRHRLRFWLMTEPGLRPLGEAEVDIR